MLKQILTIGAKKGSGASLSVGQKLFGVVTLCIGLLIAVAGTAIYQLNNIGQEIAAIAEEDIPLTEKLTKVTTHQLEQAIAFERAMRYGEEMQTRPSVRKSYEKEVQHFEKLAAKVQAEILDAEKQAEASLDHASTDEAKREFKHILEGLKKVEVEHEQFDKHVLEVFGLLSDGHVHEAIEATHVIEAEEDELIHELEALTEEIVKFTAAAALKAEEHEKTALMMLIVLTGVAVVVGFGSTFVVTTRFIVKPLSEVVSGLNALAEGDTSVEVKVHADDEIGQVAKTFQSFKQMTMETKRLAEQQAEVERKAEAERRQTLLGMADDLEGSVKQVVESVAGAAGQMQAAAQSLSTTAEQASHQSTAVAAASEEATNNVQTVASASEELSASIQEITRQVADAEQTTKRAVETTRKTSETVQSLSEGADKIGEVVGLITDIAEQTNLLALNATIEAARAGDAGKGFAVVASEVKSLATQTTKATDEISAQITGVQTATKDAVSAIKEIGGVIEQISEIATAVASAVEEQNAATGEIARNVQQASAGTQEVSSNITGVQQAAGQTGQSAKVVLDASTGLTDEASTLRTQIDRFLSNLRAA
ncbi:MAG: methyl-accepting chemotaxis protein [Minwuiales bacterium]|nr:methyl-accepting chemotaxis protein [Minwuiales bacterium]